MIQNIDMLTAMYFKTIPHNKELTLCANMGDVLPAFLPCIVHLKIVGFEDDALHVINRITQCWHVSRLLSPLTETKSWVSSHKQILTPMLANLSQKVRTFELLTNWVRTRNSHHQPLLSYWTVMACGIKQLRYLTLEVT